MASFAQGPTQSMQFRRFKNGTLITGTSLVISSQDFGDYNRRKFSFGAKIKRTGFGVHSFTWCKSNGSNTLFLFPHWSWRLDINPSDHLALTIYGGPQGQSQIGYVEAKQSLRDLNVRAIQGDIDFDNPIASERLRLYINGVRVTQFHYTQWPTATAQIYDGDEPVSLGGNSLPQNSGSAHYYFNGFMENAWFVSGRNPSPSEINNPNGTSKDLKNLPDIWALVEGDDNPLSLDAASGDIWINNGVTYGQDLP